MKCKVLIRHHSYPLRMDLEVGTIVDLPEKTILANKGFYEITTEEAPSAPPPKVDRATLEKTAIKRKLVRPEEAAALSTAQLVKLLDENQPPSMDALLKDAMDRKLGEISVLEKLNREQLTALINGAK